ncbi:hypothetical protein BSK59_14020 [Paenibacillus odorifer]|uniref:hypothetical protein n=1 Tax=Paenibacillus odorifer TaxID=189426 RepID=UPI00096F7A3D|nr:hypothetical protein [Paenibacillus odorifer]OME55585.1 hypothetical protein BSK59_14020 [Paenibacillus odorifer]
MTQRDWQKDMERVNIFEHAKTLCNNPFPPSIEYEPTEVALGYWLQEAKELQEIASGRGKSYLKIRKLLQASVERERQLVEAIENALKWTWYHSEANMTEIDTVLNDILSTLYPDTPAPTVPREEGL